MAHQLFQTLPVMALLALAGAAPLLPAGVEPEPFDPNPQYSYSYSIQDAITGDTKGHSETRNGDVVQGQYSVVDADGTRRIVDYTADAVHGFNAVVRREGTPSVAPVPVATHVIKAAPVVRSFLPAPLPVRAAPQYIQTTYSAPRLALASAPVPRFVPGPALHYAASPIGSSAVHTSVSTPFHSYTY